MQLKMLQLIAVVALGAPMVMAQSQTISAEAPVVSISSLPENADTFKCRDELQPGMDTFSTTLPFPFASVVPQIASFNNLAWSGLTEFSLDGDEKDNKPGMSRTYTVAGAVFNETLINYVAPVGTKDAELVFTVKLDEVTMGNLSFYSPEDTMEVTPECDGAATKISLNAQICGSDSQNAVAAHHMIKTGFVQNLMKIFGGHAFKTCDALTKHGLAGTNSTTNGTDGGSVTSTTTSSGYGDSDTTVTSTSTKTNPTDGSSPTDTPDGNDQKPPSPSGGNVLETCLQWSVAPLFILMGAYLVL